MLAEPDPDEAAPIPSEKAGKCGALPTPRPILASDVLREDVAPIEPGKQALRCWMVALGLGVVAVGVAEHAGFLPGGLVAARVSFAWGGILLALAAIPLPYVIRCVLAAIVGMTALAIGLGGYGPLAPIVRFPNDLVWEGARALAASSLAAALLFRARYRAYRGARVVLAASLVAALPALVNACIVIATGHPIERITSAVVIAAVLTSLLGFMGAGTTAASNVWAITVVAAFGSDVMARALWATSSSTSWAAQIQAGLAFAATTTLMALGGFQFLAWAMASDARRVDVLQKEKQAATAAPNEED